MSLSRLRKFTRTYLFSERRAIWRVLKLFQFFCFPRHRASGPVPAVIRNAGEKLTRSHPPPPKKKQKQKRESIIYRKDRQEDEAYKTISCYFSVGQETNCLALILGGSLAVSSSQNMWNFSPFSTALPKQSSLVPRAYPVILTSFYRVANFSAFEHQHGRRVIAHF